MTLENATNAKRSGEPNSTWVLTRRAVLASLASAVAGGFSAYVAKRLAVRWSGTDISNLQRSIVVLFPSMTATDRRRLAVEQLWSLEELRQIRWLAKANEREARNRFGRTFTQLSDAEAKEVLMALHAEHYAAITSLVHRAYNDHAYLTAVYDR